QPRFFSLPLVVRVRQERDLAPARHQCPPDRNERVDIAVGAGSCDQNAHRGTTVAARCGHQPFRNNSASTFLASACRYRTITTGSNPPVTKVRMPPMSSSG